jgi:aspartyl-tRNA(Asn)/glutamyl-tRNA(Gln) amidotransferase subunit A
VELMKALIARAERVNPKVNCFADRYFDEALEQAKRSEARYMRKNARTAALEGIPLAVKDCPAGQGKAHHPGQPDLQGLGR